MKSRKSYKILWIHFFFACNCCFFYQGNLFSQSLKPFRDPKTGKYGFVDSLGKITIPAAYDEAYYPFSGCCAPVEMNNKWGYIDKTGKTRIPFQYDDAYGFSKEGVAHVGMKNTYNYNNRSGTSYGIIDEDGKQIVPIGKYCDISNLGDDCIGLYEVKDKKNNIIYIADSRGKLLTNSAYSNVARFSEDYLAVQLNGKWGYMDAKGIVTIPFQYEYAGDFSGDYAAVKSNDKEGYIDKSGAVKIPFQFDDAGNFTKQGIAIVRKKNSMGLIDKKGKVLVPFGKYDEIDTIGNGMLSLDEPGGKFLIANSEGKLIIATAFSNIPRFKEGMAAVQVKNKWGYIDTTGVIKIPVMYDDARDFSGGVAKVIKNNESFYIDKTGLRIGN